METREKILEVAMEHFTRLGVRYVTMDDIARAAGMSKKTIYQEFKDKEQLVFNTFENSMRQDQEFFTKLNEESNGALEHFVEISKYIRSRFSNINPLVFSEIQRYYPKCWQLFEHYKHNCAIKTITDTIDQGKAEGYFRPEIDSNILAMIRLEQISSTFDPTKFPPAKFNIIEVQMAIMDHFIHGLLTDKGRELFYKINNQD
ncbi:TetR/AcrR family transcriptional regulator [Echinicola sp. 20G]|uniref:TetR/AcrR family transcriptional regulator n=1 Tax=Echinicola sp. 20G TaxID=2781961 RepID=UPI00190FFB6E|nr:TetR/AcrR family transcriptional regulator [Echinicola sp. 20G]